MAYKTNVVGTLNMLGLAKRVGARFLLTSTSEVYGDPLEHPQKGTHSCACNCESMLQMLNVVLWDSICPCSCQVSLTFCVVCCWRLATNCDDLDEQSRTGETWTLSVISETCVQKQQLCCGTIANDVYIVEEWVDVKCYEWGMVIINIDAFVVFVLENGAYGLVEYLVWKCDNLH